MSALVKVDTRPYRQIAQENWGLTDEQMIGMHVHHRYPVSRGGTNDASNLYVCSPSFHYHGWHGGGQLKMIETATANGRKGAALGGKRVWELGVGIAALDHSAKARRLYAEGKGLAAITPEQRVEYSKRAGAKSGQLHKQNGTGVCGIAPEEHSKRMSSTNQQRWCCSVCGNFESNARGVNRHLKDYHGVDKTHKHKL
jgi:hypothetical protein